MKNDHEIIWIGAGVSFLLFIIFGLLEENESKFLSLSSQWIIISLLPILISLFIGGYITKFKGFGFELESTLRTPVSTLNAADNLALYQIPFEEKGSREHLSNLSKERVLTIKRLVFITGYEGFYKPLVVEEYFEALSNLIVVEVINLDGQFVCFIPIDYFRGDNIEPKLGLPQIC